MKPCAKHLKPAFAVSSILFIDKESRREDILGYPLAMADRCTRIRHCCFGCALLFKISHAAEAIFFVMPSPSAVASDEDGWESLGCLAHLVGRLPMQSSPSSAFRLALESISSLAAPHVVPARMPVRFNPSHP